MPGKAHSIFHESLAVVQKIRLTNFAVRIICILFVNLTDPFIVARLNFSIGPLARFCLYKFYVVNCIFYLHVLFHSVKNLKQTSIY